MAEKTYTLSLELENISMESVRAIISAATTVDQTKLVLDVDTYDRDR